MFLLYTFISAFTECDGIEHFAEHVPNLVQGCFIQKYYCAYVICLCRKQLEDILSNLKEKPDVGTLLLVSHQMIMYRIAVIIIISHVILEKLIWAELKTLIFMCYFKCFIC